MQMLQSQIKNKANYGVVYPDNQTENLDQTKRSLISNTNSFDAYSTKNRKTGDY